MHTKKKKKKEGKKGKHYAEFLGFFTPAFCVNRPFRPNTFCVSVSSIVAGIHLHESHMYINIFLFKMFQIYNDTVCIGIFGKKAIVVHHNTQILYSKKYSLMSVLQTFCLSEYHHSPWGATYLLIYKIDVKFFRIG